MDRGAPLPAGLARARVDPVHAIALVALEAPPGPALAACAHTVEAAAAPVRASGAHAAAGDVAWPRIAAEIDEVHALLAEAPGVADLDAWIARLGAAIARLDHSRDRLRAEVGLAAAPRQGAVAPVSLPTPVALVIDGRRLDADSARHLAAGTIAGEVVHDGWAFAMTGPDQGWSVDWDDYAVLAVPDRSWMARRCKGSEIDPDADELSTALIAAATGTEVDHDRCVPVLPPGDEWPRPLAALGAGDERSIVIVREQLDPAHQTLFDLVVSTDAGAHWKLQPGPPQITSHALADAFSDRVAGTVDLLFRTRDAQATRHVLLQLDGAHPLTLPPLVETGELVLEGACRAGGATWWFGAGEVHRARGGVLTTMAAPAGAAYGQVVDCSADAALVALGDPIESGLLGVEGAPVGGLLRCAAGQACAPAPGAPDRAVDGAALLPDGSVVYVAARGPVLAVWGGPGAASPTNYALPREAELHGVVVWAGTPWAIVIDAGDPGAARRALSAVPLR